MVVGNPTGVTRRHPALLPAAERHGMRALLTLVVSIAALGVAVPATAQPPVGVTEFLRLRTVSEIEVARDGLMAIIVVNASEPDRWQDEGEAPPTPRSNLWRLDLSREGSNPRVLTTGAALDGSIALSPDGRSVAFVRTPAATGDNVGNVWVLPLDGGEARQVTFFEAGASQPAWSPDGRTLAVVSPVELAALDEAPEWPQERPGRAWNDEPFTGTKKARPPPALVSPDGDRESQRAWLAWNAARGDPLVITRLDFQNARGLEREARFDQIFLVDAFTPEVSPRQVTRNAAPHAFPQFIDGGRRLVAVTVRGSAEHLDRVLDRQLWSFALDGSDARALAALPGWTLDRPRVSADGSLIGVLARRNDEPSFRPWIAAIVDAGNVDPTTEPVWLTAEFDRSVERWCWWPGAGDATAPGVLFSAANEGGFPLLAINEGLLAPLPIAAEHDGQPVGVHAFGAGAGTIVFARTTPSQPCVLVRRDASGERELLDLNPWVKRRALSTPEARWVPRADSGVPAVPRIQMFAMPPANWKPGTRAATIVAIHGGPARMWGPGELSTWHELQWLCGRGFGVIYCNPRGSAGYGEAFVRANRQDWGPGPAGDVLAAVDAALALPWVDPNRLAITGGSYGGYLTAFTITRDDRFKAAVAHRGVYDFATFFGEGRAWRLLLSAFGGTPFEPRLQSAYERNGILRSLARVKTPLLVSHGDRDRTTGVSQSEVLYRALRYLGKPVEYVRYPDADHDLSRRGPARSRIDRLLRMAEFIERFVGPASGR